jgi:hypothetical protein
MNAFLRQKEPSSPRTAKDLFQFGLIALKQQQQQQKGRKSCTTRRCGSLQVRYGMGIDASFFSLSAFQEPKRFIITDLAVLSADNSKITPRPGSEDHNGIYWAKQLLRKVRNIQYWGWGKERAKENTTPNKTLI